MAGETIRTEAVCLDIRPWSRTSHIVSWLTPQGPVTTVVKGAVRPKSAFLGQYDVNYLCDIVYYARAKGDVHALRECAILEMRSPLRGDWRALSLTGYFRALTAGLAPGGGECRSWFDLLDRFLTKAAEGRLGAPARISLMLAFELEVLRLSGLRPDFSGYDRAAAWSSFSLETGAFCAGRGRCVRVPREVAEYLAGQMKNEASLQIPLDAARVVGVFYHFHLDCASDVRRAVLAMIS